MKTEDKMAVYETLFNMFNNTEHEATEDDKTFRKEATTQITERDKKYTELLNHFVEVTKIRNCLKEIFKWTFYLVIIISIVVLIMITYSLFHKYIYSAKIEQMVESLPLLVTSMVGFVSAIITIPVTITKYLFSTKEDENITQIILHTQEHDTSGRQWAMDFKKIADDLEGEKIETDKKIFDKDEEAGKKNLF